jgi:hypothetical protein
MDYRTVFDCRELIKRNPYSKDSRRFRAGPVPTIGASPGADRWPILAIQEHNLDPRSVAEPRPLIVREVWVQHTAVFEFDRLEHPSPKAHHDRAFNLILQVLRIDDRPALEGRHDALDTHAFGRQFNGNLGAGPDVRTFFKPDGNAEAVIDAGLDTPTKSLALRFLSRNSNGSPCRDQIACSS